ncbi:hypothetical protein QQS21_011783 [Conoideocrella luteorostrata]|uniref:Uncharacterized protein n=1 Tax=Conoideocrella luteorostrata TaxID=1105319 RepID=A0AAJ0FTC9_9HYPO|nr:hypothetical protein QQS21_011783 [Conoideocrella luteorostrata]
MRRRVLTDEERQRVNAHNNALEEALRNVDSKDFDAEFRVRLAVDQAHPLSQETRDVMVLEKSGQFADPLREIAVQINGWEFKPDSPWGLVVYRTAYGDDDAWKRMLDELQDPVDSLPYELAPNPDLYPRHRFEIMDDRSQFEGATIETLHAKFSEWVVDEYRANCKEEHRPSVEELNADTTGKKGYFSGARYNFFLVVDDICLESLDQACGGVVKFVQVGHGDEDVESLSADEIEEMGPKEEDSNWEGGVTESEFENVGWMYMQTGNYVVFQEYLADPDNWEDQYLRPPRYWHGDVEDWFVGAPGSWRK